ncbi:MAG TPA: hypothetical protein VNO86_05015 [Candidatus Binatia bacterium]|nr:hypothetical protein [Candidatus Binatia bacterium]
MANPALLAFLLVLALLALLPARRLHLAGWSGRAILAYYLALLGLGVLTVELRALGRLLVPVLIVAYLAPFVTIGDGLGRLLGTRGRRPPRPEAGPPPKNVTPPVGLLPEMEARATPGDAPPAAIGDDEPRSASGS